MQCDRTKQRNSESQCLSSSVANWKYLPLSVDSMDDVRSKGALSSSQSSDVVLAHCGHGCKREFLGAGHCYSVRAGANNAS
eukprot:10756047-Ditylum_brightwellii.AAC.1